MKRDVRSLLATLLGDLHLYQVPSSDLPVRLLPQLVAVVVPGPDQTDLASHRAASIFFVKGCADGDQGVAAFRHIVEDAVEDGEDAGDDSGDADDVDHGDKRMVLGMNNSCLAMSQRPME